MTAPAEKPDDTAALVAWETIMMLARQYGLGVHKTRPPIDGCIVLATPEYQRRHQSGPHGRSRRG